MEQAIFAAGFFWDAEAAFRRVRGVVKTEVGYVGGWLANPSYEQVCGDDTGHAEAVRVGYDPRRVSYRELLAVFWQIHDPTTVNRQGADIGSQYRSAIFWLTPEQAQAAHDAKAELGASAHFGRRIVTEIRQAPTFYLAEDYHQQYLERRQPRQRHG
jgi:peptide-methionine (S)-S-oxide reductase